MFVHRLHLLVLFIHPGGIYPGEREEGVGLLTRCHDTWADVKADLRHVSFARSLLVFFSRITRSIIFRRASGKLALFLCFYQP